MIMPADRTAGVGAPARRTYAQDAGNARSAGRRFRSGVPCLLRNAQIAARRRKTARRWKIATFTPDMASRWARPVRRSNVTRGWEYGGTSPVARERRYREPFVVPATRRTHSPVRRRAGGKGSRHRPSPATSGRKTAFAASAEKEYCAPCAIAAHSLGTSPGFPGPRTGCSRPAARTRAGNETGRSGFRMYRRTVSSRIGPGPPGREITQP